MGQLIIEQIISVDGYAADEHGGIDFFADASCLSEADEDQLGQLRDVAAIVLGRVTFGMFANYWPDADPAIEPIAPVLNSLPKYVVSNTLDSAPWGGDGTQAGILHGDGVEAVRALRSTVEGDVIVWGSLSLTDCARLREGGFERFLRLANDSASIFSQSHRHRVRFVLDYSLRPQHQKKGPGSLLNYWPFRYHSAR